jgi:hypothetical protein
LGTAHSDFGPWLLRSSRTFPDASRIRLQRQRRVPVLHLRGDSRDHLKRSIGTWNKLHSK